MPDDLNKFIEIMEEKISRFDLSDDFLLDHSEATRYDVGIGEYIYGITMVPCEWVLPYLKELRELKKGK